MFATGAAIKFQKLEILLKFYLLLSQVYNLLTCVFKDSYLIIVIILYTGQQVIDGKYNYAHGELGFSVHMALNNDATVRNFFSIGANDCH